MNGGCLPASKVMQLGGVRQPGLSVQLAEAAMTPLQHTLHTSFSNTMNVQGQLLPLATPELFQVNCRWDLDAGADSATALGGRPPVVHHSQALVQLEVGGHPCLACLLQPGMADSIGGE